MLRGKMSIVLEKIFGEICDGEEGVELCRFYCR